MIDTLIVALVFAALLALEWRYRRAWLRLGIVALAVVVHVVATPSITVAARQARAAPPEARVRIFWGDTLSEYMSGVDLMREYMADQFDLTAGVRPRGARRSGLARLRTGHAAATFVSTRRARRRRGRFCRA